MDKKLPSVCKEHPKAKIVESYSQTFIGVGPGRLGKPVEGPSEYKCAVCGKELCSPKEYALREKTGTHFA